MGLTRKGRPKWGPCPKEEAGRATSELHRGAHLRLAAAPLAGRAMWGLVPHGLAKEGGLLPPPIYIGAPFSLLASQFFSLMYGSEILELHILEGSLH